MRHPFFFRGRPIDYASVISRVENLADGTGSELPRAAINCTIRYLDLSSGKRQIITLTNPADANPSAGLVSIFSPLCGTGKDLGWYRWRGAKGKVDRACTQPRTD